MYSYLVRITFYYFVKSNSEMNDGLQIVVEVNITTEGNVNYILNN